MGCGNSLKLNKGRFKSVIRENFFVEKWAVRHWSRLPKDTVDTAIPGDIEEMCGCGS